MSSALFIPGMTAAETTAVIPNTSNGAVLYSDGGCRPNPGDGGWGLHGYFYALDTPKRGMGLAGKAATARGYQQANVVKAGEAVTILQYVDGYGSLFPRRTNNIAELTGAIKAVETVLKHHADYNFSTALIYSDSQYVIDGITKWIHGWIKRGWSKGDGTEVANEALWKQLAELGTVAQTLGIHLTYRWVRGHNGDTGNEASDQMATQGVIAANKQIECDVIELSDAQGYWSTTADYNRMLSMPRWYFNTHVLDVAVSSDGRYAYYLGNHGKDDDLIGKRISDASFSIVYLENKVEEIAIVQDYQNQVSPKGGSSFVIGKLDNLLSAKPLTNIRKNGSLFLHRAMCRTIDLILPRTSTIATPEDEERQYNGVLITKELNPPRMAFTLVENFGTLQEILEGFLADRESYAHTEITDILYEVDRTKKAPVCKLRKEITSATKSLPVVAQYVIGPNTGTTSIPLTVGVDIMTRNDLSALAPRLPRVWVVTWRESDRAIRYATVIEAGGDIGIWAGVYANIRLLS